MYLSGCTSDSYQADLAALGVGLLVQPGTASYLTRVDAFDCWAADNGCYPPDHEREPGKEWSAGKWASMLGRISELDEAQRGRCLFALVPDYPFDHERTLERFRKYVGVIRAFGLPVAFAVQDGATDDTVPWDEIDVVFLAGTTEWKLSREAMNFAYRARDRGKWVHMGRVNSWERLDWASYIGCDSADGTFIKHGPPAVMVERIAEWVRNDSPRLTQMTAIV